MAAEIEASGGERCFMVCGLRATGLRVGVISMAATDPISDKNRISHLWILRRRSKAAGEAAVEVDVVRAESPAGGAGPGGDCGWSRGAGSGRRRWGDAIGEVAADIVSPAGGAVAAVPEGAVSSLVPAGAGDAGAVAAVAVLGVVDGSLENQAFLVMVSLRPPGCIQAAAGGLC